MGWFMKLFKSFLAGLALVAITLAIPTSAHADDITMCVDYMSGGYCTGLGSDWNGDGRYCWYVMEWCADYGW